MNRNRTANEILILTLAVVSILLGVSRNSKADFTFGEPTNLGPAINTSLHDYDQGISQDNLTLIFFRYQPNWAGDGQAWLAQRAKRDDPWGDPVYLASFFDQFYETVISTAGGGIPGWDTADGLETYFSFDGPDGYGHGDLWMQKRDTLEEDFGPVLNLGPTVNSPSDDGQINVSADGLVLYFASDRPGGHGDLDIWVTTRATRLDPWGPPVNLGLAVNSPSQDYGPVVSADRRLLFFVSERPGGLGRADVYVSKRVGKAGSWGEAMNLGPTVNNLSGDIKPYLTQDGSILYFCSDRSGGYGGYDLWQAPLVPIVDFNGDGKVDADDMSILIDHWRTSDPLCDIGPTPLGDGIVDFQDLKVLSEYLEPGFGRIAHWRLDEAEGDIAYDSVGSDHANVHGGAVWQPDSGMLGGALELDGTDDYIAPMLILNPQTRPFRMLAWIKGGAPGQVIASQTPDEFTPGGAYLMADPSDGTLATELLLANMPLDSEVVVTDNEWHEVGLEWDGEHRHLLVNGQQAAVDEIPIPALDYAGYLNIGTGPNSESGSFWSGLMDDVRVYEKRERP